MESLANIDLFILKLIEAKLDSTQLFSLESQQETIIMCPPWVIL
jgi:hypothetical protein